MTTSTPSKPFKKKDLAVCLVSMVLVWAIVRFWLPAAPMDSEQARILHLVAGLFSMAMIFLGLACYGVWRFSAHKTRWIVLGMVVLPAVYAGLLLGGLRGGDRVPALSDLSGSMRAQDGLAALWWGTQAASDLPQWSRGGKEPWPTLAGDMVVSTHKDHVEVSLFPSSASPRQCERMLSDLSSQASVISSMGGWVMVNGQRWQSSEDPQEVCANGGIMSLVSRLPSEG